MNEKKTNKRTPMERVNTRIMPEQREYIKKMAWDNNLTEGEAFRIIIDFYIIKNK